LRKYLYGYAVPCTDFRSSEQTLFSRVGPMDMRLRKPVGHPIPEIAAFVADMKEAFGERDIDEAMREVLWRFIDG